MLEKSDSFLVDSLREGSENAYMVVIEKYGQKLYAYLVSLSGNKVVSQDLLQNVFLKLWEYKEKLQVDSSLKNYLYKTAYHEFINHYKRNHTRKLIEEKVFNEAIKQIDNRALKNYSLVLNDTNWHEGVLGIVASRIKEKYNKPVFLLKKNNNMLKGSGRSIPNIDIGSLVILAKQKNIILNGGGHQMAAGITLPYNKLDKFKTLDS